MKLFPFAIAALLMNVTSMHSEAAQIMYLASITDKTIVSYELDDESGNLTAVSTMELPISPGPMCFSPCGSYLYAAMSGKDANNETIHGIATLKILSGGKLEYITYAKIDVRAPYLKVDPSGNFAMTAHYSTGEVNVYRVSDKIVTSENLDHHTTERTAHCIEFDPAGKFVYVPHTAPNKVYQYRLVPDSGKLTPLKQPWVDGPDENHQYHQPRHIAFHPTLRMAYTSNERGGGISSYELNTRNGMLTRKETLSSLPDGYTGSSAAADIKITPDGKFVYVSNRDTEQRDDHQDSIAAFRIDSKGKLTRINTFPTVWFPRSISIDGTGKFLIAAGQKSGTFASYRISADSGKLTFLKEYDAGDGTIWTMWQ